MSAGKIITTTGGTADTYLQFYTNGVWFKGNLLTIDTSYC